VQKPQEGMDFKINMEKNQIEFTIKGMKKRKVMCCPKCDHKFEGPLV